ncbi:hypothetical protein WJX73_006824 [Symbiochloris irregularis]|uniref:AD domain-containing protein n=1 Tax=Symbiochloris irregularis TaxID=706552 RepID=A0AAW1NGK3_9CHLO
MAAGLADPDVLGSNHDWAVGYDVRLTTTLGEEISGEVFTFDKVTNCVVLKQKGTKQSCSNLCLLKANFIKAILSAKPPAQPADLRLPHIDPQSVTDREAAALQAAREQAAKIGVGVTREGQQIFDSLEKQYRCEWRGKDIAVLGCVIISEPYQASNCRTSKQEDQGVLERIQKMVEAIHQKSNS